VDLALLVGHGGGDPGAVAIHSGVQVSEHEWCRVLADLVEQEARLLGLSVARVWRPPKNLGGYAKLPELVNNSSARCCVELHLNSAASAGATGTETLCWHASRRGNALAICIQSRMVAALGLKDRGVKLLDGDDRGAALLRRTSMPCVIVEPGFLSSPADYATLEDARCELAAAIAQGVHDWLPH
jgi:N-acetylmuramoyl-L-alanine amidase